MFIYFFIYGILLLFIYLLIVVITTIYYFSVVLEGDKNKEDNAQEDENGNPFYLIFRDSGWIWSLQEIYYAIPSLEPGSPISTNVK
jgi:hypothetical protein